jgi:hypothetical protein
MTGSEHYKKAWHTLSWFYGVLVNSVAVGGFMASAELWGGFGASFESLLTWADILAGNSLRVRAGLPQTRFLSAPKITILDIVEANFWIMEQRRVTYPMIQQSVQQAIEDEQKYLQDKQRIIRKRKLARENYIPAWRLDRMRRSYVSSMSNVSEQLQLRENDISDMFPFAEYLTRDDRRVRPTHALMHRFFAVRNWDGWPTIVNPNGYNCRCHIRLVARFEAIDRRWMGKSGKIITPIHWPTSLSKINWDSGKFPDPGWDGPKVWTYPSGGPVSI